MLIVARLAWVFALAAVLSCSVTLFAVTAGAQPVEERETPTGKPRERPRPPPSSPPAVELASDSKPSRPQCRIYFGCPPAAISLQQ